MFPRLWAGAWTERADGKGGWVDGVKGPRFARGRSVYPADLWGDGLTDLFLYNPSTGASWTERADGKGGWVDGVKGPQFAAGWSVYTAHLH